MQKTSKIQVECLTPPTNFFENLSIGLKMSRIRELYQIFHIKKTKVNFDNFSRRYSLSNFFFTVFFGNQKDFLKEFPQSQCKFSSWNLSDFPKNQWRKNLRGCISAKNCRNPPWFFLYERSDIALESYSSLVQSRDYQKS